MRHSVRRRTRRPIRQLRDTGRPRRLIFLGIDASPCKYRWATRSFHPRLCLPARTVYLKMFFIVALSHRLKRTPGWLARVDCNLPLTLRHQLRPALGLQRLGLHALHINIKTDVLGELLDVLLTLEVVLEVRILQESFDVDHIHLHVGIPQKIYYLHHHVCYFN